MEIHWINLINYRSHVNLEVEFKPGFNVIAGVNGSGKTSLLKAICDALTGLTAFMTIKKRFYQAMSEPSIARQQVEEVSGRYRFEEKYPVSVSARGTAFGVSLEWKITKTDQLGSSKISGQAPGQIWSNKAQAGVMLQASAEREDTLPLAAFYRANRQWNIPEANEMQAATARNSRTDGYESWADAALDSNALQSWIIGKSLERFQTSSETGKLYRDIDDDELALVNNALKAAVENIAGLKYDLKQKSVLIEWADKNGTETPPTVFSNLSDGQRTIICLVADIARRMCLLNPHLGVSVTQDTPGVVLIDELDMHLHPRWQRLLTTGLKSAFPRVQFIAASHSPQVLGELKPEEIILLTPGGTEHPQISYGLTSSQILEQLMGADARSTEVDHVISSLFEKLEHNDLTSARQSLAELENTAPGIPEIAGAHALLRRKEVLGR